MIEVFKTTIKNKQKAKGLLKEFKTIFPQSKINFDLDDYDRILRIEGNDFTVVQIKRTLLQFGYTCEILE